MPFRVLRSTPRRLQAQRAVAPALIVRFKVAADRLAATSQYHFGDNQVTKLKPTTTFRRTQSPYNFQSQAGSSSDKYVRKIMMVKFDGRVKAGRRLYEQKGAALHLKVSDIDMTVRGLTRLVEKRSREMGVSSSFVLTDAHGFQLSHDTCGPTDLRASSKKILACLKSNYEKHFGGSSETLATLLADSPDV